MDTVAECRGEDDMFSDIVDSVFAAHDNLH